MPLLPAEPALFPEDLLAAPPAPDADARWWALHTRPRAEKALARKARAAGLAHFLPQYERRWTSRGRTLRAHMPLFSGYLFLFGDGEARRRALETNLVANCLPVPDGQRLRAELEEVWRLMGSGAALNPEARGLTPGTRVEIVAGPLAGLEGTVLRAGTRTRFYVEVTFLRRGVSAEVEAWMIRPLGPAQAAAAAR
jgi:transcription antitermination factor NusG